MDCVAKQVQPEGGQPPRNLTSCSQDCKGKRVSLCMDNSVLAHERVLRASLKSWSAVSGKLRQPGHSGQNSVSADRKWVSPSRAMLPS